MVLISCIGTGQLLAQNIYPPGPPQGRLGHRSARQEPAFVFVEHQATFQGGNLRVFQDWVQEHIQYPQEDMERGITRRATVQFVVNRSGHVINVQVLRHATPTMDAEAMRVILSSPEWEPARQGSYLVNQQFTIPVEFNAPE